MATLGQDVLADGALGEQGIARHELPAEINLPQHGKSLRELVLSAADGHLGQHGPASAGVDAQQVGTRQVRAGFGAPHRLAIDGQRLQVLGLSELRRKPGAQHGLEGHHVQACQYPMQRVQTRRATLEPEGLATPGLVRPSPFGKRQQAAVAAQHPAAQEGEHRRQAVATPSRATMIRHRLQGGQQRGDRGQRRRHPASVPLFASNRKPPICSPLSRESKGPADAGACPPSLYP